LNKSRILTSNKIKVGFDFWLKENLWNDEREFKQLIAE
jgi:hypothetical protein